MSNPGVILLSEHSKRGGSFEKLRVEDNLGESIHIHLDDYRVDLTLEEFKVFSDLIWQALVELDDLPNELANSGFLSDCYDAVSYAKPIINLKKSTIESLKFIKRSGFLRFFYLYKLVKIGETAQYQYLTGESTGYEDYPQKNHLGISNTDRLESRSNEVLTKGKNARNPGVVVFGDESVVVRDGMHACSILAAKDGISSEIHYLSISNVKSSRKINQPFFWSLKSVASSVYFAFRRLAVIVLKSTLLRR
jgi:hypothetical protein